MFYHSAGMYFCFNVVWDVIIYIYMLLLLLLLEYIYLNKCLFLG